MPVTTQHFHNGTGHLNQERYPLINAAIASGLKCQVSYPIWLQEERFGVSLAFQAERTDLAAVLADVAFLANTICPALFRKVTDERIGYMAHGDGDCSDELLRNADTALYRAKEAGRHTFRVFEPAMVERQLIQQDLRDAIAQQHLTLASQPICSDS